MAYYKVPPPGYPYDYPTTASNSPAPDEAYNYYVSQYRSPETSPDGRIPSKRHVRTASYTPPRTATWGVPAGYPAPSYYTVSPGYPSPSAARHEHVSTQDSRTKTRRYSTSGHGSSGGAGAPTSADKRRGSIRSPKQRISVDAPAKAEDRYYYSSSAEEPLYARTEPRVTRQTSTKKTRKADSYFFFTQTTTDDADTPTRSRARRSSTATRPNPAKPVKAPREPNAEDAVRHKIPAGYCLKNWDPTEAPILLLGSVFDANSLGKWIYDWTVYHHKAHSPLAEVAGELWLLLIRFAGKKRRAEECLSRIRGRDNRDMIRDFLESGDRIWAKLKYLLKSCEEFMWHAAKKEGGKGRVMGEKSGIEFVKSIFGRDRELEKTEKLMTNVRLWIMRFDANCDEIMRKPRN
ncbi:MAG: hypothetical protein LQ340_000347 [Diploschistes diacapsis]|nr:MAG: hypothetical protein LQ340_000347 [Diploschistes diacapsis]